MTQSKFSTDLGEQLNELFKLDKRVFEPASKKDAEYLKRLSKGEETFLQEVDFVMEFDQVQTAYDETDATTLSIRANPNHEKSIRVAARSAEIHEYRSHFTATIMKIKPIQQESMRIGSKP